MSTGTTVAPHRFENGNSLLIAGLTGRYTVQTAAQQIPDLWHRLAQYLGSPPGEIRSVSYGVSYSFGPDKSFTYMAGVPVPSTDGLPPKWESISLTPQRYAVFRHTGPITEIGRTVDGIWRVWFRTSGLEPAPAPNYELYTEKFDPEGSEDGLEIWIPVA